MKRIILIIIGIFIFQICFSQTGTIKGHIYDSEKKKNLVNIDVYLLGKGLATRTDINGFFEFDSLAIGTYNLIIVNKEYPDSLLKGIKVIENSIVNLDIKYPPPCQFDKKNNICPICHKRDMVIPIIYGHPTKELKRKAKRKEILLGGCKILKCVPHWYCKRDKKQF